MFVYAIQLCHSSLLADPIPCGMDRSACAGADFSPPLIERVFRFVTVGDTGRRGEALSSTGDRLRRLSLETPFQFVGMVGDLAYPNGFQNSTDPNFQFVFQDPFADIQVPFNPVLGDNDYGDENGIGSLSVYPLYSQVDDRWDMPSLFYSRLYEYAGVSICSVYIDTQSLVGIPNPEARSPEELAYLDEQLPWLDMKLGSERCQTSNFIVVFGHHPLISVSKKGNKGDAAAILGSKLDPLFDRHRVDAYFAGHDHDMQATTLRDASDHSMSYIVSGSSSRLRDKAFEGPLVGLLAWVRRDVIGFTISEVSPSKMTTIFLASATGEVVHSHKTWSHRGLRMKQRFRDDNGKSFSRA